MTDPSHPPSRERRIAHLDMDAFYASVELLRRPELRGLPVAIGGRGDPPRRGGVAPAPNEARAFGIRSGMALRRAAELCPGCIFLPVDFEEYRRLSRRFKAAVAAIAPTMEDRGIDEVYLDLTQLPRATEPLACALKAAVREATGLGCSIAVAPNKLLAKIGSDLDKPDGLTLLCEADIPSRIWPLPVRRINGIGPKAEARLEALGLRTIGELAAAPRDWLVEHMGRSYGAWLHEAANGRDERPVTTHSEPKSRSRETTFDRDLHPRQDRAALRAALEQLCEQLSRDLASRGYLGRTVGVKLRFDDFSSLTRDVTLAAPVNDADSIKRAVRGCLARTALPRRLRLLGVRMTNLSALPPGLAAAPPPQDTLPLFGPPG